MYILDQTNAFEVHTTDFLWRDEEIVREHKQLFLYFLEIADSCSILNLNPQLLEHQTLHIEYHCLDAAKKHYHFRLGPAERQFIQQLSGLELQCTFEKNQTLLALFDEHILFFDTLPLPVHFIDVQHIPPMYELVEEAPQQFSITSSHSQQLLKRLEPVTNGALYYEPRTGQIQIQTAIDLRHYLGDAMLTYYEIAY